jgi:hypothetical protein
MFKLFLKGGKMVKKKGVKKLAEEEEEKCDLYKNHCCHIWLVKIATMAFLLFLITVWPWLSRVLLSVHWGIYLGIALLITVCMMIKCYKNCKKK